MFKLRPDTVAGSADVKASVSCFRNELFCWSFWAFTDITKNHQRNISGVFALMYLHCTGNTSPQRETLTSLADPLKGCSNGFQLLPYWKAPNMTQSKPLIQLYSEQHFPAQRPELLSLTMLCPDDSIAHTSIQTWKQWQPCRHSW